MAIIELIPYVAEILVSLSMGLLGTAFRKYIQYKRDGVIPESAFNVYADIFIGAGAGFLSWLFIAPIGLRAIAISAVLAGYAGTDFIDNTLGNKK